MAEIDIKFKRIVVSRLKYFINTSGVNIDTKTYAVGKSPDIRIEVYNSRDTITPGYIQIPIENIPEVIQALARQYEDSKHLIALPVNYHAEET